MAGSVFPDRIVEAAREKFFAAGFSKVTMDELANDLGVSKKTMYKYFPGKDELLQAVIEWQLIHVSSGVRDIIHSPVDYIEKLHRLWTFMGRTVSSISKQFQEDLRRYHPELWKRIEEFRREQIITHFTKLVEEGMALGIIRDDVDKELLVLVYLSAVQGIINPEVLTRHSFSSSQAFRAIIGVMFDGILTDAARQHYRTRFKHDELPLRVS